MLSTKGIGGQKFISKTITPGNRVCKINGITLEADKIPQNAGAYYVKLDLETEPIGDGFLGFYLDNNDKSKGQYSGQVGKVRSGFYSFKDSVVAGENVFMINQILGFLSRVATELGVKKELDLIEAATIEDYIPKASEILSNGKFLRFCIGGKQYSNKAGYDAYELFIVRPEKGSVAIESTDVSDSKMTKYNENDKNHFKAKKKPAQVNEFDAGNNDLGGLGTLPSLSDDLPF